ncbi:uncharacterized protein G2W53_038441 [Senna tora]|uniref:Uncharacterized protein n=1 Tax=Senna tora TaxID=362788 RepID=A0A834SP21_9FABA|nr:uncharacterized protein G2W53_038441 [Senna tora]
MGSINEEERKGKEREKVQVSAEARIENRVVAVKDSHTDETRRVQLACNFVNLLATK